MSEQAYREWCKFVGIPYEPPNEPAPRGDETL